MEVGEGEVVHLRGPNGAGKTSLLKVLAGLLAVHSGEATVLGRDLVAYDRSVDMHVSRLRKKLGRKHNGIDRIKTIRGVGFIYT